MGYNKGRMEVLRNERMLGTQIRGVTNIIKGITIKIRGILRNTKGMGTSSLELTMVAIATTKVVEISLEGME